MRTTFLVSQETQVGQHHCFGQIEECDQFVEPVIEKY